GGVADRVDVGVGGGDRTGQPGAGPVPAVVTGHEVGAHGAGGRRGQQVLVGEVEFPVAEDAQRAGGVGDAGAGGGGGGGEEPERPALAHRQGALRERRDRGGGGGRVVERADGERPGARDGAERRRASELGER